MNTRRDKSINQNDIQIIERREKDIDALRNLYLRTRVKAFSWVDTSQFKLSDFERETDGEYILVALDGELLVGFGND